MGWVNSLEHRPWKLFHVLARIDQLRPVVNCVGVKHILREGNAMADYLVKHGRDRTKALCKVVQLVNS